MNLSPGQFKKFLPRKQVGSSRMMTPLARPEGTPESRAADLAYGQEQAAKKVSGPMTAADRAYQARMRGGYR